MMRREFVAVEDITSLLKRTPIHVYDQSDMAQEALYQPFAWADVFLREVNRDPKKTILHIWPMEQTLILGMLDRRLPYCEEAIKVIRDHGYRAVVRNVGGLAVIADAGILNFSFVLPKSESEKISITSAYELMYCFIQKVINRFPAVVNHFEVHDSYCPGDYDLSINGKKFAGIAQRRFKNGIMISIYLSVTGDQNRRGELVKQFYEHGLKNETTSFQFPKVNPQSMANLSDLLNVSLTVNDVKQLVLETLNQMHVETYKLQISDNMLNDFRQFYDKMIERNRKF